jgi:hypothetical protein
VAAYRTDLPEPAGRKDDRHWIVLEKDAHTMKLALCTLSVLADKARREQTDALAQVLASAIAELRFGGEARTDSPR